MPALDRRRSPRVVRRANRLPNLCRLGGTTLHGDAHRVVRCVCIGRNAGAFQEARALHEPDFDATPSFRTRVTHSQHFPPVDSCDVNDVACGVNSSRMTVARRSTAPPAAQTKAADQGSATRFDRCERSDAQWTLDMSSGFVGRRCRRGRAIVPMFAGVALDRRCDARSSCETFRRAPRVRSARSANRTRSQGGWFEYCCRGTGVTKRRGAWPSEEGLMT